jgi:hypothetical protein
MATSIKGRKMPHFIKFWYLIGVVTIRYMHKETFVQKINEINILSSSTLKWTKGLQRNVT